MTRLIPCAVALLLVALPWIDVPPGSECCAVFGALLAGTAARFARVW